MVEIICGSPIDESTLQNLAQDEQIGDFALDIFSVRSDACLSAVEILGRRSPIEGGGCL